MLTWNIFILRSCNVINLHKLWTHPDELFRACFGHLGKSVPSEAGVLLRVALLDDLAAPGGHRAVQEALADAVRVCGRQLWDVVHSFKSHNINALAVALKLHVALKNKPSRSPGCLKFINQYVFHIHFISGRDVWAVTHQEQNGGEDLINWGDLLFREANNFQCVHHRFVARAIVVGSLEREKTECCFSKADSFRLISNVVCSLCEYTHSSFGALFGVHVNSRIVLQVKGLQHFIRASTQQLWTQQGDIFIPLTEVRVHSFSAAVVLSNSRRARCSLPGRRSGSSSRPHAAAPPWTWTGKQITVANKKSHLFCDDQELLCEVKCSCCNQC